MITSLAFFGGVLVGIGIATILSLLGYTRRQEEIDAQMQRAYEQGREDAIRYLNVR